MSPFLSYHVAQDRIQDQMADAERRRLASRARNAQERRTNLHAIKRVIGLRFIALGESLAKPSSKLTAAALVRSTVTGEPH